MSARLRFAGFDVASMIFLAIGVHGADLYVAPDGNDGNPGTLDRPLRDPVKAAAKLMPGDTLFFREGEYRCRTSNLVGLSPPRGGEEGKPIAFRRYGKERVQIDCEGSSGGFTPNGFSYIVIDGFEIVNRWGYGIRVAGHHANDKQLGHHVTIRNCEVRDTGNDCLYAADTPHLLVENCHLHGSTRGHGLFLRGGCHRAMIRNVTSEDNRNHCGIEINAAADGIRECLIDRCLVRGNAQGFSLMGVVDSTFRNNVLFNNGMAGFREYGYREIMLGTYSEDRKEPGTMCEGNTFENNTFVNTVPPGSRLSLLLHSKSGSCSCLFQNNIFVIRGKPIFNLESCDGFEFQNNCLFNPGGQEQVAGSGRFADFAKSNNLRQSGTIEKDPLFVDMEKGDLRLKEESPCIDAGTATGNRSRIGGKARDIGAFERGAEVQIGCRLSWEK